MDPDASARFQRLDPHAKPRSRASLEDTLAVVVASHLATMGAVVSLSLGLGFGLFLLLGHPSLHLFLCRLLFLCPEDLMEDFYSTYLEVKQAPSFGFAFTFAVFVSFISRS